MSNNKVTDADALAYHLEPTPGKFEITASVPMTTQRDLSLAYSPGVAVPCVAIADNPELAYDYTNKGNLVAVISNGTAVLGLGNLGALGSKPVMEGKAVLFKRFADVNSIDIELDTENPEEFINAVKLMGPTFGGINLEDIKACSMMKHSGALMSSRLMPPKVGPMSFTALINSSGFSVSSSISIEFTSAKRLNKTALPSMTGLEPKAPRLPRPKTAVPFEITATRLPLLV